jgi:hypothetical protein
MRKITAPQAKPRRFRYPVFEGSQEYDESLPGDGIKPSKNDRPLWEDVEKPVIGKFGDGIFER